MKQKFDALSLGDDGSSGKHGVPGTVVEIFADKVEGYMDVIVKGGPGNRGQDGEDGKNGVDSSGQKPDKTVSDCRSDTYAKTNQWGEIIGCTSSIAGTSGARGGSGGDGGYAGKSGNGGNAEKIKFYVREVKGTVKLTTCRGAGGSAAANGKGGDGGKGGQGGRGIYCEYTESGGKETMNGDCEEDGQTSRAPQGDTGTKGKDGQALVAAGSNGQVRSDYNKKVQLTSSEIQQYPIALLKLMLRSYRICEWYKGKDPFATIDAAIGVAGHFSTKCNIGTIQNNLAKVKAWLQFGKAYRALKDSSELDFDKIDVAAVPEVMKERLLPRHKAKFEEQVERFFIAGAARIDLIAKVIDLDNAIGGYNFDIPNLEEDSK
ncbi:hypothetical protein OS493_024480 [Desmophyllum pertusum]|uniref:Uncharacterized protein n=1 Tax=Desmophyllum pertusum TaxID=174260 RepID=A0A9X0CDF1_9CNID|nr:hypothetical protein OS493_024480 [Desmophyllum pertusum]